MAKKRVNVYELKDLRNPILRKKAEKKFKRKKNPKDYENPDYYDRKMGGKVIKKPMGGKVYKVDNSGQQMVAKQYGGKIHG
mgnify:CR=1 FL=1|tara:strand:+ start:320 stop:562 length:243 start_codon:yes stop_codon:yes gene_type:complete